MSGKLLSEPDAGPMIPFGLFYALTTFHRFVNDVLHSLLDNCVVVFLAS